MSYKCSSLFSVFPMCVYYGIDLFIDLILVHFFVEWCLVVHFYVFFVSEYSFPLWWLWIVIAFGHTLLFEVLWLGLSMLILDCTVNYKEGFNWIMYVLNFKIEKWKLSIGWWALVYQNMFCGMYKVLLFYCYWSIFVFRKLQLLVSCLCQVNLFRFCYTHGYGWI